MAKRKIPFILTIILGILPLLLFTPPVFADWSASGSCDFAGFTTISASETFPDEASCRAYIAKGNGICKEKADAAGYGFLSYTNFTLTEDCHQTGGDGEQQPAYSEPQPNEPSYSEPQPNEPSCRANEYYSNGRCYCNTNYARFNGTCVPIDQGCQAKYGANNHGENGKCVCDAGYRLLNKACVTFNQWCSATYGGNAYEKGGTCYCGTGYVLNEKKICAQEAAKQPPPKPTAASEKNEVQEKPTTASPAKVLRFGIDVKRGDTITAQGGPTVIFMSDGERIDLKEGATMRFYTEDEIEAQRGIFRFLFNELTGVKVEKRIRTSHFVTSIRGTEFLVETNENNSTVKVIEGTVEVSSLEGKGTVQVTAGQEIKAAKDGLPTKPKVFDPKTLDNWWEGLPKEAPSDSSDFWVGLIALGVLGGVIYLVFRKIRNVLRGKEKSKAVSAVAAPAAPVTPKRSFILRWGNIILFILMIVLGLFVGIANSEGANVAAFLALNAFYLVIPIQIVLSIIRIFKKYHRFRSFIWLFIIPIVAFLLVMSFLPPMK